MADTTLRGMTAEIVTSFVAHNQVRSSDLGEIISTVYGSLSTLGKPTTPVNDKPVPHMPIKRTVTPDYLVSLEDGRQYKSLKRHLTGRGLTPDEYRQKWGLPSDYPMTAPAYSLARSSLAKSIGLGQKRSEPAPVPEPEPVEEAAAEPVKAKRSRKKAPAAE